MKAGTAVITVTTKDGGKTATCVITVISSVKSFAVSQKTMEVAIGASFMLGVVPITSDESPAKLTWASNKPNIASVDQNGKVTALSSGTATITITAENGKSTNVTVKVGGGSPPTSLTIKTYPVRNTMKVGEVFMLDIDAKPGNAQGVILFESGNAAIVSVNKAGQLTAHKAGSATITVTMGKLTETLKITAEWGDE